MMILSIFFVLFLFGKDQVCCLADKGIGALSIHLPQTAQQKHHEDTNDKRPLMSRQSAAIFFSAFLHRQAIESAIMPHSLYHQHQEQQQQQEYESNNGKEGGSPSVMPTWGELIREVFFPFSQLVIETTLGPMKVIEDAVYKLTDKE